MSADFSGSVLLPSFFFHAMKSASEITVMPRSRSACICQRNFAVRMRISVSGSVGEKSW